MTGATLFRNVTCEEEGQAMTWYYRLQKPEQERLLRTLRAIHGTLKTS